jgi:hypothetical protein
MIKMTARLSDKTHKRLTAAAKADRNSVNAELEFLLDQALEARENMGAVTYIAGDPVVICTECACLIGLRLAETHVKACSGKQ